MLPASHDNTIKGGNVMVTVWFTEQWAVLKKWVNTGHQFNVNWLSLVIFWSMFRPTTIHQLLSTVAENSCYVINYTFPCPSCIITPPQCLGQRQDGCHWLLLWERDECRERDWSVQISGSLPVIGRLVSTPSANYHANLLSVNGYIIPLGAAIQTAKEMRNSFKQPLGMAEQRL